VFVAVEQLKRGMRAIGVPWPDKHKNHAST